MLIGYARVSTPDQTINLQSDALKAVPTSARTELTTARLSF
jgi:DNA invertase Pin-like site-specific DNA recombinase